MQYKYPQHNQRFLLIFSIGNTSIPAAYMKDKCNYSWEKEAGSNC